MPRIRPTTFDLGDCRVAHGRTYDLEIHDGGQWVPHGRLAVSSDAIVHDGTHVHTVQHQGAHHALVLRGKADDPTFLARLHLTEDGAAFVGTMGAGGGATLAVRGAQITQTFTTQRRLASDASSTFTPWDTFTISSAWVDQQLQITYLLGSDDVSDRTRVTKVDRRLGETTLEMPAQNIGRRNSFAIVLAAGSRSFTGTYVDDADGNTYTWSGEIAPTTTAAHAAVFRTAQASRPAPLAAAAPTTTLSYLDLDNVSAVQVVTDSSGKSLTVDHAQTTCGGYFNKCLTNALEQKWIDGIYGHAYTLPTGVANELATRKQFYADHSVLGTGQMLYDQLGSDKTYQDLIKRIDAKALEAAWKDLGTSVTVGPVYQKASNALYLQAYGDVVDGIKPYLADDPEKWAAGYFDWLSDTANLLTWQIQVASSQFDNVKTRMYEWYVKLQVLAPDKDYGQRFLTTAYAALLGATYSNAQWSDDLKPHLQQVIANAIDGKADPALMDQLQQQQASDMKDLLKNVVTQSDQAYLLVDDISTAITAHKLAGNLQRLAQDPNAQDLIGAQMSGARYKAWNDLTRKEKAGLLGTLFYGASACFVIYQMVQDTKAPQTPKQVVEEINLGVLCLALLVKGAEKLMSLGVGRYLQTYARATEGAFASFASDLATWFAQGGKVVPSTTAGKAFVAVFGDSSATFMARRIGPALAVVGAVLSCIVLYDAVKAGFTRTIVFEAINTFFSLASVVLIGLDLASFAWAGPVGLGLAAVGLVIVLVQFIWDQIDPPPPPRTPIDDFVDGPMVAAHFAT